MIEKKKSIITKLLISVSVLLVFMIIKSGSSQALTIGELDFNGGEGIPLAPETYLFGDYWCVDHSLNLVRTEGNKFNSIVHINRTNSSYYNESNDYELINTPTTEQSIAAGYLAYLLGAGSNVEFQNVVWASGQWSSYPGYVDNLVNYTGTKLSGNGSPLADRAEGWASFYYNLLAKNNYQLNIDVKPTSEEELRIYVDQNARTYTEGPYMINIVDSDGNIITNHAATYHNAGTIGNLLYQEISGLNAGCSYFQFARLNSATATVSYTDGSSDEFSNITILDANGNVLAFPKPGEVFYIRIEIPSGETRTVSKIEPHFSVQYLTDITGETEQYTARRLYYELKTEKAAEYTDSIIYSFDVGRGTLFRTNATIGSLYSGESINSDKDLLSYLEDLILDVDGIIGVFHQSEFEAYFNANDAWGNGIKFTSVEDYYDTLHSTMRDRERRNISGPFQVPTGSQHWDENSQTWVPDYKDEWRYNGGSYGSEQDAQNAADNRANSLANNEYNNYINSHQWNYLWGEYLPTVDEYGDHVPGLVQPIIVVSVNTNIWTKSNITNFDLIGTDCTVEIGGKVWVDVGATKESSLNGRLNNGGADTGDHMYGGMLVDLHLGDKDGTIVASTTTDSNGQYHFDKLNALEKYTVVVTYNGQLYQQTYYKDDLSGGFSNAQEIDRAGFNDRFDTIDSYPNNYELNGWHIAYGKNVKLKDDNGNYISNGDGALTYIDAWNQFINFAMNDKSYNNAYNDLSNWLSSRGVGSTDRNGVIQFIKDCMISANTRKYPVYEQFVIENIDNPGSQPETETAVGQTWNSLYITKSDQSRNVDFGINERDTADLALQKDVYKATVRVNGKTQTYMYNNKDVDDEGNWEITIRAADGLITGRFKNGLFNGATRYTREIRKSEYLYDGTIYSSGGTDARDLKVYVTYRIAVRNQSQTYDAVVNEITDYFDTSEYMFDGKLNGDTYTPNSYSDFEHSTVTSYIGDKNGNYVAPLTVKTSSGLGNGVGNTNIGHGYTTEGDTYSPIYLSGINDKIAKGGGMTFIYLTFEVKKSTDENGMDDRIQMDVNVATGEADGVGKQNIAEINGYSTYYGSGETVPATLNSDNSINNTNVEGQKGGVIDLDSTVGNLTSQDLNSEGDLIITDNPVTNRSEDDTDKAPNIRLVFPTDDSYERVATGYVYEDERNQESNQAMVGNGRYDDGETKINGVTVQLVELIQNVDANGIPVRDENGNYEYLGEYIWNATTWNKDTKQWVNANSSANSGSLRYYSGQGNYENDHTVSPIISGVGATYISGYTFGDASTGQYAFKAIPAGDFIIRFIYGDTTQTVLTTADGEGAEVVDLLKDTTADEDAHDGYISTSGLNTKSYNGQDYKSTTYQSGIDQSKTVVGSYNDIYGYGYGNETDVLQDGQNGTQNKYNTQNYNYTESAQPERGKAGEIINNYVNETDGKDKSVNYYYNIGESQVQSGVSDAKDIGNVREYTNNYSRGISGIDGEDTQTIVNGRAEVLASGLKVASTDALADGAKTSTDKQIAMLKELMENTEMVAQTGVINTEVEWNTNYTDGQGVENSQGYVLEDIDLGLSERPVAQLKMNKEVSNVRITLQNGTILFDTNRPVTNMPFADHEGHTIVYNPENPEGKAYRLMSAAIANNSTKTPELITTYMDEELMYGARIEVDYTFTVTNVGEVDYLDNQFYYTGVTNNTGKENISTTTANTVVDYITNNIQFLPTNSKNTTWSIRTVDELTTNPNSENTNYAENPVGNQKELNNNKYYNTLNTYNNIVTNKSLGDTALYPEAAKLDGVQSSTQTTMMLSTTLVPDSGEDTLVYNNLSEIVQVSNSQGRRLKYSITGNQPMANQDYGSDVPADEDDEIYTKVDLVTPKEIDADSSQEILILPPTGANRNYTLWIIVGIVALVIIAGGIVLIRKYFKKNK